MPEEIRFFLRTALYTALIGTIYWIVSYEWAGTVMLASLLGASLFFIAAGTALHRTARRETAEAGAGAQTAAGELAAAEARPGARSGIGAAAQGGGDGAGGTRAGAGGAADGAGGARVGDDGADDATPRRGSFLRRAVGFDAPGEDPGAPLELADQIFPTASLWPLTAAVAATLVGLGAIYGPWLWIPGASMGVATGTAWLTQLRP